MFQYFDTLSSAGSNLLIPDCELTGLRTADAFFYKQIFFTFVVPLIFAVCTAVWGCIAACRRCCKIFGERQLTPRMVKNYCILSIVLNQFGQTRTQRSAEELSDSVIHRAPHLAAAPNAPRKNCQIQ